MVLSILVTGKEGDVDIRREVAIDIASADIEKLAAIVVATGEEVTASVLKDAIEALQIPVKATENTGVQVSFTGKWSDGLPKGSKYGYGN